MRAFSGFSQYLRLFFSRIFSRFLTLLHTTAPAASDQIAFLPRDGEPVSLYARIGQKTFRSYDGDVVVYVAARRFLVELDDLGGRFPTNGDRISWKGAYYRLGNPDGGPPWRWHGNDRKTIAVYATEIIQSTAKEE